MTLVKRRLGRLGILLALAGLATWGLMRHQGQLQNAQTEKAAAERLLAALGEEAHVTGLTLHAPQESFVLQREGGPQAPWMLESPVRTLADDSVVEGMVHTLQSAAVSRTLEAPPAADANRTPGAGGSLALFGLEPPQYHLTVTATAQDGSQRAAVVMLGKKNSFDNTLYAKRSGASQVLLVPGEVGRALEHDLFALRDKRPLPLAAADIVSLDVHQARDGKQPARHFTLLQEDGRHRITASDPMPLTDGERSFPADDQQAETLLSALVGLRAKRVAMEAIRPDHTATASLAHFGLAQPRLIVGVHWRAGDGNAMADANLLFGELRLGETPHYFVKREGSYPILELGSDWALKKFRVPLEQLRDLHVLQYDPDQVQKIRLQAGNKTLELQKAAAAEQPEGNHLWHLVKPDGSRGAEAVDTQVIALLYKLKDLRAERLDMLQPDTAALRRHGLAPPQREVTLWGADAQPLGNLRIGTARGTRAPVRRQDGNWIGEVSSSALHDVTADAAHFLPQPEAANPNSP